MDVRDNTRELRSRLAEAKQQIRDLREKLNISESTAFFPANRLQKYKCEECGDILEAVLGERLDFREEERAGRQPWRTSPGKPIWSLNSRPESLPN
nr:putative neuroblastoma breakpoint family member 5 isoform X2 [Microcebus murinus]